MTTPADCDKFCIYNINLGVTTRGVLQRDRFRNTIYLGIDIYHNGIIFKNIQVNYKAGKRKEE